MYMFKKIQLEYNFDSILNANYDVHSGTCIAHQAKEIPEIYKNIGGHPKSYCLENTTIHQLWWDKDTLDFDNLSKQLGMEIISVSSIRQDPGNCIPYHKDMFYKVKKDFPNRSEPIVRANIFLEDYKLGHFFQATLNETHQTVPAWCKNEGYIFDSSVYHLSSNAGLEPKYTLQISGFLLD
jgi:hypothetical protein